MPERKVYFITHRFNHHSPHSGYDRLTDYMGIAIFETQSFPGAVSLKRFLLKNANPGAFAFEMKIAWKMINTRRSIFHILYPRYRYIDLLSNLRQNHLVTTVHGPPSHLTIGKKIRRLSAVVCVGSTQVDYLAKFLGRERVFFVPHGIDTEFFSPPASFDERNPSLCLFVGSALRDFTTLQKVIELVTYQRPAVKFILVIPAPNTIFKLIRRHFNVEYRTNVPESELLGLYRSSSVMVMPLLDTTANNAILEGMACGLPIVVTDVGSIRDYLNPECAILVPPENPRIMAEEVVRLLDDRQKLQSLSENARQQALKFSWPEIVKQLQSIYQTIA